MWKSFDQLLMITKVKDLLEAEMKMVKVEMTVVMEEITMMVIKAKVTSYKSLNLHPLIPQIPLHLIATFQRMQTKKSVLLIQLR